MKFVGDALTLLYGSSSAGQRTGRRVEAVRILAVAEVEVDHEGFHLVGSGEFGAVAVDTQASCRLEAAR